MEISLTWERWHEDLGLAGSITSVLIWENARTLSLLVRNESNSSVITCILDFSSLFSSSKSDTLN